MSIIFYRTLFSMEPGFLYSEITFFITARNVKPILNILMFLPIIWYTM